MLRFRRDVGDFFFGLGVSEGEDGASSSILYVLSWTTSSSFSLLLTSTSAVVSGLASAIAMLSRSSGVLFGLDSHFKRPFSILASVLMVFFLIARAARFLTDFNGDCDFFRFLMVGLNDFRYSLKLLD